MSKFDLKAHWEALDGKKKSMVAVGGALVAILLLSSVFSSDPEKPQEVQQADARKKGYENTFFADDRGLADMETLNAKVAALSKQVKQQNQGYEETQKQLRELNIALQEYKQLFSDPQKMQSMESRFNQLKENLESLSAFYNKQFAEIKAGNQSVPQTSSKKDGESSGKFDETITTDTELFESASPQPQLTPPSADPFDSFTPTIISQSANDQLQSQLVSSTPNASTAVMDDDGIPKPIKSVSIVAGDIAPPKQQQAADRRRPQKKSATNEFNTQRDLIDSGRKESSEVYIPSGSILRGVLLNGVDAPTEGPNPHPVVIRLDADGLLPNGHTFPFADCRVLAEIRGEINSERGLGRTLTLSCIWNGGDVVDVELNGYLVGGDGSTGIRGKLVTKEGQIIKKSLIAGTLGGIGSAATPQQRNSVQTGDNAGGVSFVAPPMSQIAKTGVYQGASNAADRVAQYYIDQLDQIFPFVEIPALREAHIVLTSGLKLPTQPSNG